MASDQKQAIYSGGDSTSIDLPVVINTESTAVGIQAEYEYVSKLFGKMDADWTMIRQSLILRNGRHYDVLLIKLNNDGEKSICFDITQFYVKD